MSEISSQYAAARLRSWKTPRIARSLSLAKRSAEIENDQLMREIQMGRGLVEEQDGRLLGQSSRQEQTLPLPARDLTNASVDKVGGIDERQCTLNDRLV